MQLENIFSQEFIKDRISHEQDYLAHGLYANVVINYNNLKKFLISDIRNKKSYIVEHLPYLHKRSGFCDISKRKEGTFTLTAPFKIVKPDKKGLCPFLCVYTHHLIFYRKSFKLFL